MADRTEFAFKSGLGIGVALVVLGVGAWILTNFVHITALIPAIFGIVVVGVVSVGWITNRERLALYSVAAVGVVGALGSLRAVPDIITLATGGAVDSTVGVASQGIMIVLGLGLAVIAVRAVLSDR